MKIVLFLFFLSLKFYFLGQITDIEIKSRLDSVAQEFPSGTSFSICLLRKNEIRFIGATKGDSLFTLAPLQDSSFEIGSLTKVFTSTVLADMVVNQRLKLNKKVNKVFPYKWKSGKNIHFLSLANHTSGLYRIPSNALMLFAQNPSNPYANYTYELLDTYLEHNLQLEHETGKVYSYSNLGAGVLSYALEKYAQTSYSELLKKCVLDKYGLTQTGYSLKADIPGYNAEGAITDNWEFNALEGAGGIISSVFELSKFVSAQFNEDDEVLALTRKVTHVISDELSIGLGWHILKLNTSDETYWHNGGTGGYTSSISFRTSNNSGIIILTNISAFHPKASFVDEFGFALLDQLKKN
jgi:CubicO group peptidase (beta-lactamase class C family)